MTERKQQTARRPKAKAELEATASSPSLEDRGSNKDVPSLEDQVDFEPFASDEEGEFTGNGAVANPTIMRTSSPRTEKEPSSSQSPLLAK